MSKLNKLNFKICSIEVAISAHKILKIYIGHSVCSAIDIL